MEATLNAPAARLTATQWLIVATAGLGFAFDLYEVVVQAIVLRPWHWKAWVRLMQTLHMKPVLESRNVQ